MSLFTNYFKIHDTVLGAISCMSKIVASFAYGFARNDLEIYLGEFFMKYITNEQKILCILTIQDGSNELSNLCNTLCNIYCLSIISNSNCLSLSVLITKY